MLESSLLLYDIHILYKVYRIVGTHTRIEITFFLFHYYFHNRNQTQINSATSEEHKSSIKYNQKLYAEAKVLSMDTEKCFYDDRIIQRKIIKWYLQNLNRNWENVLFTDETII